MIVAADDKDAIGKDGDLPWHLPEDTRRFKRITTGHTVVAGRVTHESIVKRLGHPLPDRLSVVISRTSKPDTDDVKYRWDLDSAIQTAQALEIDEIFVIGGAEIYKAALSLVDRVYLTRVFGDFSGDTVLEPGWLDGFKLVEEEPSTEQYQFRTYERA
jgi:dihydrofolate reductase